MEANASGDVLRIFDQVADPRGRNAIHRLTDLLAIAILAVICGADGWVQVSLFGESKIKWLSTFLELPDGVPSHDTFGRVFSMLDPDEMEQCFTAWTGKLAEGGKLIAIDGKAIRRSFEHGWDKSGMAHLVSAFVRENQVVFGQLKVADKSNEIEAIPRLLELLDLKGAVVTIDAMGCQKEIAKKITDAGGDYVLALKENQPTLHEKVRTMMLDVELDRIKSGRQHSDGTDGKTARFDFATETEGDHGRIETRSVTVCDQVEHLGTAAEGWAGLGAVVAVHSVRDLGGGKVTEETRLYITSVKGLDAKRMADLVRGHWSVENNLHWQLDVSFDEDQRRIRKGHGAENFSRLCRLGLNLLKRDKTVKAGIKSKRLTAGWDHDYLLSLLKV
jgi:predicted transposase YbfD/YdcC